MVKPAMAFLDVLREVRDAVHVPVWAYQVSGEYAMIEAAARNGWLDRERTILESLLSIRRAAPTRADVLGDRGRPLDRPRLSRSTCFRSAQMVGSGGPGWSQLRAWKR